jgi:hypothetical protein
MNRWRVGEDRGSKETDRCPLHSLDQSVFSLKPSHFVLRTLG